MKNLAVALMVIFISLWAVSVRAQERVVIGDKCSGKIYGSREVTRRARIIRGPNLNITAGPDVHGTVVIEAVLCRTGRVTDIRAVEGLPFGITESAINAVSNLRFEPAEMSLHSVSQRMRFEFSINDDGVKEISAAAAAGRLIENLDIIGNQRLTAKQILSWIKTRPGDVYNSDQITQDFNAVLATGYFDKLKSRVTTEDGVRGGIGVAFFVVELPLISEVKFDGLEQVSQSTILNALLEAHIDLRKGTVFDSAKMKLAIRVIKDSLASKGFPNAKVELQIESVSATTLSLTFVISSE